MISYILKRLSLLINSGIVDIVERIVLERSVEARPVVGVQRQSVLESVHKVWVAKEITAKDESIILAGFDNAPRVLVVKASAGEERSRPEDFPEPVQGDVIEAPALQKAVLFSFTEYLLESLPEC